MKAKIITVIGGLALSCLGAFAVFNAEIILELEGYKDWFTNFWTGQAKPMFEGINGIWALFFGAIFLGSFLTLLVEVALSRWRTTKLNKGLSLSVKFEKKNGEPVVGDWKLKGPILHASHLRNSNGSMAGDKHYLTAIFSEDIQNPIVDVISEVDSLVWYETSSSSRHCTIGIEGKLDDAIVNMLMVPSGNAGKIGIPPEWSRRDAYFIPKKQTPGLLESTDSKFKITTIGCAVQYITNESKWSLSIDGNPMWAAIDALNDAIKNKQVHVWGQRANYIDPNTRWDEQVNLTFSNVEVEVPHSIWEKEELWSGSMLHEKINTRNLHQTKPIEGFEDDFVCYGLLRVDEYEIRKLWPPIHDD